MIQDQLTDPELAELGAFLGAEDAPDDRMSIVACEGFLTGVVSSPEMIAPSQWLPIVLGSEERAAFADEAQASRIVSLLMRFYNSIAGMLYETQDFDPLIGDERGELSVGAAIVWAYGYWEAIRLQPTRWEELFSSVDGFIVEPLVVLARALDRRKPAKKKMECAAEDLAEAVTEIYEYWLRRRREPIRRAAPKVGRNEACPCGSGRKAKRCCSTLRNEAR